MKQIPQQTFTGRRLLLTIDEVLGLLLGVPPIVLAARLAWNEMASGEMQVWLAALAAMLLAGAFFLARAFHLSRAAVTIDAEGIWPLRRGRTAFLGWSEIAALRARPFRRIELADRLGQRRVSVGLDLDGSQELMNLILERVRPPSSALGLPRRFRLQSIAVNLALVPVFAWLAYAVAGQEKWKALLKFAAALVLLGGHALGQDLSLVADSHGVTIRRLVGQRSFAWHEIIAVELEHRYGGPFSRYMPAIRLRLADGERSIETAEALPLAIFLEAWRTPQS